VSGARSPQRSIELHYADRRTLDEQLVESLVTDEDRIRVTASMLPRRRSEYLASRALLRVALERYTGRPGASFGIRVADDGKPHCSDGPAISVSHSGELVVCAVGECTALGIDVEARIPRSVESTELAARYFTPYEARWLAADADVRFGMLWVLKEAYLKALGSGLAGGLATLECRIEPPAIIARVAAAASGAPRLGLWRGSGCYVGLAALDAPALAVTITRFAPSGDSDDAFGPLAPIATTA
jgi:phosphopantetheinyl transferase